MNKVLLEILCNPYNHRRLTWLVEDGPDFGETHDWLQDIPGGHRFPVREGIPLFATTHYLNELDRHHQRIPGWVAPVYDRLIEALETKPRMDPPSFFIQLLRDLEPRPGQRILDTSTGTGSNLEFLPPSIRYVGVDPSYERMREAQKRARALERRADLVQAELPHLPFAANCFDGVVHTEGLRFYANIGQVIQEMIRVTRPGGFVVIADEASGGQRGWYRSALGLLNRLSTPRPCDPEQLNDCIPAEMEELQVRTMGEDRYLSIRFRKPQAIPTAAQLAEAEQELRQPISAGPPLLDQSVHLADQLS